MRRASKDLHGERWLHSARPLFQKANVLFLGFANAAQRSSKTYTDAVLRILFRILESSVAERELGRGDRELRIAIETFEPLRCEKFLWVPIAHFTGDANAELRHIETGNGADARLLCANSIPKTFDAFADASDRTEAGNDNASAVHVVTVFARASTYSFIQRKVLLATLPIKKSPIIGSMIGASRGMRKFISCKISTRTPSGVSSNVQTTCMPLVNAFR